MIKIKNALIWSLLPLFSASAWGGGYEFARYNYTNLYSKDNKVTGAYTYFTYDIDGRDQNGQPTGDVLDPLDYFQGSFNYRFNDKFSTNLQYYRAYNLDTMHDEGIYQGSGAYLQTNVLAIMGLYRFTPNFSAFAGPLIARTEIDIDLDGALTGGNGLLNSDYGSDYGYGFNAGFSYEIPEIAFRATLGYQSEVKFTFDDLNESGRVASLLNPGKQSVRSSTDITMPRSITFDFQTGIAPKTLLLANVHWRNWKSQTIETKVTTQLLRGRPFVTFEENTINYTLGLAYQFSPKFIMFAEGSYNEGAGKSGVVNPLSPANGSRGAGLGGKYSFGDWSFFMVGKYFWLKDGTARAGNVDFDNNSVFALSTGLEYKFQLLIKCQNN